MSIAELNTLYAAAVAAIDAGSYDLAIIKLMAIKVRLATTPNITRSTGGAGSQSISWNSETIDSLIAQCHQMKSAVQSASGLQQMKVTYARADVVSDYA